MSVNSSAIKPPSSNTGAPITAPSENQCIIDWLGFTLKKDDPWSVVDLMGLKRGLFSELERGGMGYKKKLQSGHISVYYDGAENMGCHVEMTGQGCREYEAHSQDWRQLIALVELEQGKFTRLDLAVDTVDGSLDLQLLNQETEKKNFRSKFRRFGLQKSYKIQKDSLDPAGHTLYFGSGTSMVVFRVYDKQLQMQTDQSWIRFELQLRDDRASAACHQILIKEDLGYISAGIINENLAFIKQDDSNTSRCSLSDWWFNWLHHTEKLKLTKAKAIKTIEEVKAFIKKQYAPTLAMLKKGLGVADFSDFLKDVVTDGFTRMTRKHDDIIQNSRLCCDLPF